jgi:hypothetical protein
MASSDSLMASSYSLASISALPPAALVRFYEKIDYPPADDLAEGCWLWKGSLNKGGYGQWAVRLGHRTVNYAVHRLMYVLEIGAIPEAMEIGHICPDQQIRHCVRPDHLEAMTHTNNIQMRPIGSTHRRADPRALKRMAEIVQTHAAVHDT